MQTFVFDLNDKQAENSLSENLDKIIGSGKDRVTLKLKNTSGKMLQNLELDLDIFLKIKDIQELPDWVIVHLLLAEKSLSGSAFKERIIGD